MSYRFSDVTLSSNEPLPELRTVADSASDNGPDISVDWLPARALEPFVPFAVWRTLSGGEWLSFAETSDGFLLTFRAHAQFHVSADASRIIVQPNRGTAADVTRHLLLNQVLPLVLSRRGRLVLHASAVSWHGRVVAFTGPSGAGKSTMAAACAAAGAAIVTDDCLVMRRAPARGWLAVPCDAGIRLWPHTLALLGWPAGAGTGLLHYTDKRRVGAAHTSITFEDETLPLELVVRLARPGDAPRLGRLRGQAAVMALASELFRLDTRDTRESRWQFDAISALASDVPIEAMGRQDPAAAAVSLLRQLDMTRV